MKGYVSEIFSSFQGEGLFAGRRHLFLRLAGCNIRCRYCDTPDSLTRTPDCDMAAPGSPAERLANPIPAPRIRGFVERALLSEPGLHALAVTGGEPLVQDRFLAELLAGLEATVLLETNGTLPGRLRRVIEWVDVVSMDWKLPSNSGERSFEDEHREFLEIASERRVYVKVPVDERTGDDELEAAASAIAAAAPGATLFLTPILDASAVMQISPQRLADLYALAAAAVEDARVLPQVHRFLGIR